MSARASDHETVLRKARDLDRLTSYYHTVIGLALIEQDKDGATLGAGGVPFLHVERATAAEPDDPRTVGLFHTAFLMPKRDDLARWLLHATETRVPLTGASDHAVTEAIYLDDPEGNGVELYRDTATPRSGPRVATITTSATMSGTAPALVGAKRIALAFPGSRSKQPTMMSMRP